MGSVFAGLLLTDFINVNKTVYESLKSKSIIEIDVTKGDEFVYEKCVFYLKGHFLRKRPCVLMKVRLKGIFEG